MSKIKYTLLLLLIISISFSCKKDEIFKDEFVEDTEIISSLNVEVSSTGNNFIEVKWNKVTNNHFKNIVYSVYLNDKKIAENITVNIYTFINLDAGKEYPIKIIANTVDLQSQKVETTIKASTLPNANSIGSTTIYKEYKIHDYSYLVSFITLAQLPDGGSVIARSLQHPTNFIKDSNKIIIFRIDKDGNMLWYRLISYLDHGLSSETPSYLALHDQDSKGILFCGDYLFDLSLDQGIVLTSKKINELNGARVTALHQLNSQTLIAGTSSGILFSLNSQNYSVNWVQINNRAFNDCFAIQKDSKNNLFAVYKTWSAQNKLQVVKYNEQGIQLNFGEFTTPIVKASLLVDDEDNLAIISSEVDFARLFLLKLDNNLKQISLNIIVENFSVSKAFLNHKKEIIIYGSRNGIGLAINGGIYTLDKNLSIKSKRIYTELPFNGFASVTQNLDNSFNIFLHYIITSNYSNRNFVFIKTDVNGNI